MTFDELALAPALLATLPADLKCPTRVQQLAIPAALAGRDLLALARMFPFSCVRLRFANRTYGFKTNGLYPNRLAAVGCNKRSAVHREHILIAVQFTAFFAPYSCCVFQGDEPSPTLRHK